MRHRVGDEIHSDCMEATTNNPTNVIIWACISVDGVDHI